MLRLERLEMKSLEYIKQHVDGHGVGCVMMRDHVAISLAWTRATFDGKERRMETIYRARSFEEACAALGCDCAAPDCVACGEDSD